MIVLDASVLIAHLTGTDAHSAAAFEILDTEEELAIHPITLAEILVGPARIHREHAVIGTISRLGVEELRQNADEPLVLARLRASTGLRLPDCCVLAGAMRENATLATFGARLAAAAAEAGVPIAEASPA